MKENGVNLDTYWTHVNKRLAKIYNSKSNPTYIQLLGGKILNNNADLYSSPAKVDEFRQVLLNKDIMIVSNMEKNVTVAISGMSKNKAQPYPNTDPVLQDPLRNPPNSITMTKGEVTEPGTGNGDRFGDNELGLKPYPAEVISKTTHNFLTKLLKPA